MVSESEDMGAFARISVRVVATPKLDRVLRPRTHLVVGPRSGFSTNTVIRQLVRTNFSVVCPSRDQVAGLSHDLDGKRIARWPSES